LHVATTLPTPTTVKCIIQKKIAIFYTILPLLLPTISFFYA